MNPNLRKILTAFIQTLIAAATITGSLEQSASASGPLQNVPAATEQAKQKEAFLPVLWERYRKTIVHPAVAHSSAGLARAQDNLRRYAWARKYRDAVEARVRPWQNRVTPAFLERMIPATTPGVTNFTPCPACRDKKQPAHPHGEWEWSPDAPEQITCVRCHSIFPNAQYPESVVLTAHTFGPGREQVFTYCGSEPFTLFQFKNARPSFTGYIRARKVLWAMQTARDFGEAYALTNNPAYADAARRILLRFAEVYPRYLVHSGYGEIADGDPHITARRVLALPNDELLPPPGVPDRALHSGYWTAGRATGSGGEGSFVARMAETYDLTCSAINAPNKNPVFSEAERQHIERDLLWEGTILLAADPALNNKSVGNASAVALVGMTIGQPEMVRFGSQSFLKTLDDYFKPDGGPSESWSYALMTLTGIGDFAEALRGYSDPGGWHDADGKRIDGYDPYQLPKFRRVWEAMFAGLQGDGRYPPLADGHRISTLGARWGERMASGYPNDARFRALLQSAGGADLADGDAAYAIYNRVPGLELEKTSPFTLSDALLPDTGLGYLRDIGELGRDSTLVLSATDWGNHHHDDSLNLYWWNNNHELLSDLGYLWDHPDKKQTARTVAHNTALVDDKEQNTKERGGRFLLFRAAPHGVKVMEAESNAYAPTAPLYRRTVAQIQTGSDGGFYVLDLFRLQGGTHHSLVFHGPNRQVSVESSGKSSGGTVSATSADLPAFYDLKAVQAIGGTAPVQRLTWTMGKQSQFSVLWPRETGETAWMGDGWGQRDYHNTDRGTVLPYVVRRRTTGANASPTVFVTLYEEHAPSRPMVKSVRQLPVSGGDVSAQSTTLALAIERTDGGTDYVLSCQNAPPPDAPMVTVITPDGMMEFRGKFAVLQVAPPAASPNAERLLRGAFFDNATEQMRFRGKPVSPSFAL